MMIIVNQERENLSELLPWYANGTLSDSEMNAVEKALDSDPTLRLELDLILEDMTATAELAEEASVPVHMEQRFQAQLHQLFDKREMYQSTNLVEKERWSISSFLSNLFPTQSFAYAAGALMLVVAVQAGFIVSLTQDSRAPTKFQTATGGESAASNGVNYLIQFSPNAEINEVSAFLSQKQGIIVEGPTPDGFYKVKFDIEQSADLEAKFAENNNLVSLALPTGN